MGLNTGIKHGKVGKLLFGDDVYRQPSEQSILVRNKSTGTKHKFQLLGQVPAGGLGAEKVGGWFLRPAGTLLDRDLTEFPDLT
jgi:hypothetical protein